MKNQWTIGKKLIAAFSGVAVITLAIGIIGYFGAVKSEHHIDEIGVVRMPSVEGLLIIEAESEHISYLLQSLANAEASFERRQEHYSALQDSRKTYEEAWNIYEPLPQTAEEESVWKQFVPTWNAWREANNEYIELNKKYDELGIQNPDELLSHVQLFRGDLYALEKNVLNLIVNGEDFTGGEDHTATPFGQWLDTFSSRNQDVERLREDMQGANERFHAAVAPIRQAVRNGHQDEAVRIYTDRMDPAAAEIMELVYALIDVIGEAEALHEEAGDFLMETVMPRQYEANGLLDQLVQINSEVADANVEQAHSEAGFIELFTLAAMIVGVLLALGLGILITRSINSALKRIIDGLTEGADQVASASGQV
ncbi:MAG: MCP four helix bundle domain-containing protein, partial [Desulfobacteraceae bacterium]